MRAGTIVSRYWTWRRGGCVGAASFSGGFAALSCFGFFASLAGFASSAGGLPAGFASFAPPLAPFTSFSLFYLAMSLASNVHDFAVGLEEAHLAGRVRALRFQELESDPVALAGGRVQQHHVGDMQRHLLVDDPALLVLHRVGTLVLLHAVQALDEDLAALVDAKHAAALALFPAGRDDHHVAFADLLHVGSYSTSGASDTIFMKRSVRSSLVTGPKMRVPIGSSFGFSSTAALVSNLITEPSGRRTPCAVRTTTAL